MPHLANGCTTSFLNSRLLNGEVLQAATVSVLLTLQLVCKVTIRAHCLETSSIGTPQQNDASRPCIASCAASIAPTHTPQSPNRSAMTSSSLCIPASPDLIEQCGPPLSASKHPPQLCTLPTAAASAAGLHDSQCTAQGIAQPHPPDGYNIGPCLLQGCGWRTAHHAPMVAAAPLVLIMVALQDSP